MTEEPLIGMRQDKIILPHYKRGTLLIPVSKGSPIILKPNSPKTREACLILGYDFEMLKLKQPSLHGVTDDIKKLRLDHYLKKISSEQQIQLKYLDAANEIMQKRKEIIDNKRELMYLQIEKEETVVKHDTEYARKKYKYIDQKVKNDMVESFQQAFNQQNKSLNDSQISSQISADPVKSLEFLIEKEIEKYENLHQSKKRELKQQILINTKRVKTLDSMIKKEYKIGQLREKLKNQKLKQKEEQKKLAREKQDKIIESEKKFEEKKNEERERIRKKLEMIQIRKERLAKEAEQKQQKLKLQEERERQKQEQVLTNQKEQQLLLNLNLENKFSSLEKKMTESSMRHKNFLNERQFNISMKQSMENSQREQFYHSKMKMQSMSCSSLISKLISKEEQFKEKEEKRIKEEKLKQNEKKKKLSMIVGHKENLDDEYQLKVNKLDLKFQRITQNNIKRRQIVEKQIQLSKEQNNLKQNDLLDNFQRQRKKEELKYRAMQYKDQKYQEKLEILKLSNELLKEAQNKAYQQFKDQSDLLETSVHEITESALLNRNKLIKNQSLPNLKKKYSLIKSLISPEDSLIIGLQKSQRPENK